MRITTKKARLEQRQSTIDRLIAEGWEIEKREDCELIICTHFRNGKPLAMGFKGSAGKAWFFYRFSSIEERIEYVKGRIEFLKRNAPKARKSPDASEHFTAGDVLYNSWGYDQTNVDWYQVTKVKGKSIWLREIWGNSSDAGNCSSGYTQPRRFDFKGGEFRKTVQPGGHISADHGCMSKWDGKAKYCSSYH